MAINYIDLFFGLIALILMALGAWSGLVRSLFRLAALAAGTAGVWLGSPYIRELLSQNIANLQAWSLYSLSWSLGFLAPWLALTILGSLSDRLVRSTPLNIPNCLGGALFGLFKALIIAVLLAGLLEKLPLRGALLAQKDSSLVMKFYKWVPPPW